MFPTWSDWQITYTSKGLAKKRAKSALRYLAYAAAIAGIIRLRRAKNGASVKDMLKAYVRQALLTGGMVLQVVGSKV
jgi:hypothetical protein